MKIAGLVLVLGLAALQGCAATESAELATLQAQLAQAERKVESLENRAPSGAYTFAPQEGNEKYLEGQLRELEQRSAELDRSSATGDARSREAALVALVATKEKIEQVKRQLSAVRSDRADPEVQAYRKEQLEAARAEVKRLREAIEKMK